MKHLGSLRDGVLVGVALVYGAGYAVWSLHAWRFNMGVLPALDFQYFVAGLIPVMILLAAFVLGRILWRFVMHTWPARVGPEAVGGWRVLRLLLFGLLVVSLLGFFFASSPSFALALLALMGLAVWFTRSEGTQMRRREVRSAAAMARGIGVLVLAVGLIAVLVSSERIDQALFAFSDETQDQITRYVALALVPIVLLLPATGTWPDRLLKPTYFVMMFVFLPLLALLYYVEQVYPRWPQELGGGHPRCAFVEGRTEAWTPDTRRALFASQPPLTQLATRSHPLQVLYANDDILLVRAEGEAASQRVYELKKSDLNAIVWCDADEVLAEE